MFSLQIFDAQHHGRLPADNAKHDLGAGIEGSQLTRRRLPSTLLHVVRDTHGEVAAVAIFFRLPAFGRPKEMRSARYACRDHRATICF